LLYLKRAAKSYVFKEADMLIGAKGVCIVHMMCAQTFQRLSWYNNYIEFELGHVEVNVSSSNVTRH
jgi:hypothetical protein